MDLGLVGKSEFEKLSLGKKSTVNGGEEGKRIIQCYMSPEIMVVRSVTCSAMYTSMLHFTTQTTSLFEARINLSCSCM